MKFERIAYTAIAALLATACSGGDEQAAPDTIPIVDEGTTSAPPLTTTTTEAAVTVTTIARTSTTAVEVTAPGSLAFSSSNDLGRLFEVLRSQPVRDEPNGEAIADVADGELVQAIGVRQREGGLWVQVRSVQENMEELGWMLSTELQPTDRIVLTDDPLTVNQFRRTARALPGGELMIMAEPSSGQQLGSLLPGEIAVHGGSRALASDGTYWVDVSESVSGDRLGWVHEKFFAPLTSIEAKNSTGVDVARRKDTSVTYGALLNVGSLVAGCNAVQITFESLSTSNGTAIVFGQSVPTGSLRGSTMTWRSDSGSAVYGAPGEDVIFSLPRTGNQTWYFAHLDIDFQAETVSSASGRAVASNVQQFQVSEGACSPLVEESSTSAGEQGQPGNGPASAVRPELADQQQAETDEASADDAQQEVLVDTSDEADAQAETVNEAPVVASPEQAQPQPDPEE